MIIAPYWCMLEQDTSSSVDPSLAVVNAVADAEDVDPMNLDPPLGTVVDTDALNTLFPDTDQTRGQVTFRYSGYRVTVDSAGNVTLD